MKFLRFIILLFFSTFFYTCVEPFDVNINGTKGYVLVDGTITDLDEPQIISLFLFPPNTKFKSSEFSSTIINTSNTASTLPLTKANVQVIVNGSENYHLTEIEAGFYQMPTGFKGKVGNSYQLKFRTDDGRNYESSPEKMVQVPKIMNLVEKFNAIGIVVPSSGSQSLVSTSDFYVDFEDTPNEKNFYRWKWTDYEITSVCETCKQSQYNIYENKNGITGDCFRNLTLPPDAIYDYTCEARCWDSIYSSDINIQSDIYTDGLAQKSKLVAQIPLFQLNPCLVSIQQTSLTANAFRYFDLLNKQSLSTGTLADTPPAPLKGNVLNADNSQELVLGFFTASSVSEVRFMLDRRDTKGGVYNGLFKFINHREINLESGSADRQGIPLAICKKSLTRTPIVPKGWQ